jgi:hypothetical protein
MNFKCLIDGRVMEMADVTDKHLKEELEQGLNLFLKRVPSFNSLPHNANVLAYFEDGKLRYRVNLQKAN